MNRRTLSLLLAGLMLAPTSLMSAPAQKKPMDPKCSCKNCKKCGPKCDCKRGCKCKLKCKCKSKCCKAGRSPILDSAFERPPHSRPPHGRPSPSRHSRYKEMIKKFDKDKDGKLDGKEREALKKYIQKRRG
jgi:hypothetical protein